MNTKDKTDETQRAAILVVDDEGDIRQSLEMLLTYEGYEVWTAKDGNEAIARLDREAEDGRSPVLVLTDLKMPGLDGLGLLDAIQERESAPPVILISGHGDVAVAVDAMKRGASNFLEKPLDENRVLVTLRATLRMRKLTAENTGLRRQLTNRWEIIGASAAMQSLREQVQRVAQSDAAVLITGENGTGKEIIARNVHYLGARATGPFVTVNCAAIPHELVESELFGHEKGSFTGAVESRTGHFEAAQGGSLFLDEVGDMPLDAQAKVLRALETHEVTRVGDSKARPVDLRVIAATNADLPQAVEEKSFRMDLFYRLNVVPFEVPALRDHREDVVSLAEHFLAQMAERTGRAALALSPEAAQQLMQHEWPGNVRQLRNLLEGAAVFADEGVIGIQEIEHVLAAGPSLDPPPGAHDSAREDPYEAGTFEEFKNLSEAQFFRMRLERNEGNIKRTAEELGMQRSHLYKKLDRYSLR
ncbi:MAG: sigma-54 dependent transcriptional regulator [Planctomycetota bacterium]|jgi:two-component system nitrogen regulation response regulator NtrX|nr:sigma-54 dependent transcriptional regulator [Planctomycetota bacterium]MDP6938972.1 sigma-54 dependent transcriptional regulator [Planctomycetota bacterium]